MNQMSFLPQPPPLPAASTSFSGARGTFFRLVGRGAALELVTLGFYRFWLATDIRRHLWTNTIVDGDAAEYTGRGKELLIGFLFAMAILVPIYLAYFLVSVEAERFKGFAGVPLVIGFYAFGQFAIYRARRYRLTRTVWRGVRFLDGWLGLVLCRPLDAVGDAGRCDAWPRLAVARGCARALQDAAFLLRRPAGRFESRGCGFLQAQRGGCGCAPRSRSCCFRCCLSSMRDSRRSSGAGGCQASGSATRACNRRCSRARSRVFTGK